MAKVNVKEKSERKYTHGGSPAQTIGAEAMLRRTVCACMLWEDTFYEDGVSVADRIKDTIPKVSPERVASIAIDAREKYKLRHVPLLIVREMARSEKHRSLVAETLARVIQRPDELAEFAAIYWMSGKAPLCAQVKKGLARAFTKFDAYQLAKYNRGGVVKLRDVLFLCHAKPLDEAQDAIWKKLIDGTLEVPDTWEVGLSAGRDKRETWERLLNENKLGAMALLRNLRNMEQAEVPKGIIQSALQNMKAERVLPFRYLSAAKHAMHFEADLERAMLRCLANKPKLYGKTIVVIDVSGSMYDKTISSMSEMDRAEVACAIAMMARELCEDVRIYATAGNDRTRIHETAEVPARRGFALKDAIYKMCQPLGGGGIFLTPVTKWIKEREKDADRIIVVTDEQDCAGAGENAPSKAEPFGEHNYLINVSTNKNGIGYGKWTSINGFSESVIDYICTSEGEGKG